jgi:hypothetical protein
MQNYYVAVEFTDGTVSMLRGYQTETEAGEAIYYSVNNPTRPQDHKRYFILSRQWTEQPKGR